MRFADRAELRDFRSKFATHFAKIRMIALLRIDSTSAIRSAHVGTAQMRVRPGICGGTRLVGQLRGNRAFTMTKGALERHVPWRVGGHLAALP